MKIAIIADIHANITALRAFPEPYDELWVIGDLVNFGPNPGEVIDWVRAHAHCVVRGDHDHAVGYGTDPRCIPEYQAIAKETGEYSSSVLTESQKEYLRLLPLSIDRSLAGFRFHLCHATPQNPLFGHLEERDWVSAVIDTGADILILGHTHEPVFKHLASRSFLNPGSVGGLKITSPDASYATWENGRIQLKRYTYPVEMTVASIQAMPISEATRTQLSKLITTGGLAVVGA